MDNSWELTQAKMEAILRPDSEEPFETFFSDLMEQRSEAKSMFKMMKHKDPDSLALKLAHSLSSISSDHFREKCAQLLGKLILRVSSTFSSIKCILLDRFLEELESNSITREAGYSICVLTASLLVDNNWSELLPFLYQCVSNTDDSSSNIKRKEITFFIFAQLADNIGEIVALYILKDLHSKFFDALNDDTTDFAVRRAAMKVVISFILCVPARSNEKERFQNLLPAMMKTLNDMLSNDDKEEHNTAKDVLNIFIELAKSDPKFFRQHLVVVVGSMMDIAEVKSSKEVERHLAIEFLLSLVEARKEVPSMMKKVPLFTDTFFALLLNLLLDIKDEPSWHSAEAEQEDAGVTKNYVYSQACFDWISKGLGGKAIAPIAIEQLSAYFVAPEWDKCHAALIELVQIAEGSSKVQI